MDMQFHFCRPAIRVIIAVENTAMHPGQMSAPAGQVECHQEREILIPLEGTATIIFDRKSFCAKTGTAFLIDSWVSHSVISQPEQEKVLQLWIHLHDKKIFASLVRVTCPPLKQVALASIELPQELLTLLSRRWDLLHNSQIPPELADKIRHSIMDFVLDELEFLESSTVNKNGARNNPVQFIKRYVENTRGRGCSIADFEKIIGYNRCYLARLFKAQTGVSITNFINQVRFGHYTVASAKGFSQKEIADQLGFSCQSAFSRWKKSFSRNASQKSTPVCTARKKTATMPALRP